MTLRCSAAAAERGDPLVGTAPPQRDWLLVEHAGPWPVTAPFGADLPTALLRRLGHPDLRTLLVRRHGRAGAPDHLDRPRRWFCLRGGRLRAGWWSQPDDLLDSLSPGAGEACTGPLVLVCTHGVHDVCCALKGRPVAAALAARWPEETWECSHLGGDRFAPNVLLLPDLACYAGMPATEAAGILESHFAGRAETRHLRGIAGLHPAQQVAITAALRRWGPASPADLVARPVDQSGPLDAATWTVELDGRGSLPTRARAVMRSSRAAEAALLTCRATRPTRALRWEVVTLDAVAPAAPGAT